MEKVRSNSKIKVPKVKALSENVSPLHVEMDDQLLIGRGRHLQSMTMNPSFQPYAENIDVSSPLVRYIFASGSPISGKLAPAGDAFTSPTFGSSKYTSAIVQPYSGNSSYGSRGSRLSLSPLSSIENSEIAPMMSPPLYGTPVKVDEEVLVMDDILVSSNSGGKSGRSSSSGSCSRGSSSSSSSAKSVFKTEICRAWEESGNCRYSSKCQFAHGKEELYPTRLSTKYKSETGKSSMTAGSCTYGPKSRAVHQHHIPIDSEYAVTTSQPNSPVKPEPDYTLVNSNTINDWSPLDDGIEIVLPHGSADKAPTREEVDEYIFSFLSGPAAKRRLPVFAEIF